MKPIIISPPFGTYINDDRTTSVLGTFTPSPRGGRTGKILQFILDNIRRPVSGGWRNRIGLRNPGISSIKEFSEDHIYSLVGLEDYDWEIILCMLEEYDASPNTHFELNLGCRNVHVYGIDEKSLTKFCQRYTITVKLPAGISSPFNMIDMCARAGVHYLHAGNTLLSDLGSLSGRPLKAVNLPLVEKLAKDYPQIPIIGGGGIYSYDDLYDYFNAGAQYFSLATIWFYPWRARRIINQYYERLGTCIFE